MLRLIQISSNRGRRVAAAVAAAAGVVVLIALLAAVVLAVRWRARPPESAMFAFDDLIREAAARHGLCPYLVKGVIKQESDFRPMSVGGAGEIGLMQITRGAVTDWERATGRRCPFQGMLFNPRLNIEIGTWYLARAFRRWRDYGDDAVVLALAEYNAGYSNARKWVPVQDSANALDEIRFPGTRQYIVNVLRYRDTFQREASSGEGPRQFTN